MHTITLSDSLAKEIDKVAHEFGFSEKQFVEEILKEKVLEYKKRLFVKGAADIKRKLALKNLAEDEIIAEFERFRHAPSGSPVAWNLLGSLMLKNKICEPNTSYPQKAPVG